MIQRLQKEEIKYDKTQAVEYVGNFIDTPGEYAETKTLGGALGVYSYESDVIGLVASATEHYTLFPPCIAGLATRPVIGIVTKCDAPEARPDMAELWLRESGCEKVFFTSSYDRKGIDELLEYIKN